MSPISHFSGFYSLKVRKNIHIWMAKCNIQALPFSERRFWYIISNDSSNSRPVPVRRMTVGSHLEKNFTAVFVGSSGSASDTTGTGRNCNFKAVRFLHKSACWDHDGDFSTVGLAMLFVWAGAIDDSYHGWKVTCWAEANNVVVVRSWVWSY